MEEMNLEQMLEQALANINAALEIIKINSDVIKNIGIIQKLELHD